MDTAVEELRQPTAESLLRIWREARTLDCDDLERGILCNARVLAESCYADGRAVFEDAQAVLALLTLRQMEILLRRLAGGEKIAAGTGINPRFDEARFAALREG